MLLATALAAAGACTEQAGPTPQVTPVVSYVIAEPRSSRFDGPFEGRTGVVERSFLSLDVAGTVAELLAPAGSRLEAGLPIVRIEPGDAGDQLQPAEKRLQQARRDARRAQARFGRHQRMAA